MNNLKTLFLIFLTLSIQFSSLEILGDKKTSLKQENYYHLHHITPTIYNVTRGEAIRLYIMAHRMESGGFKMANFTNEANPFGTVYAVKSLKLLGALNEDIIEGVFKFLMRLYNEKGYFCISLSSAKSDQEAYMMESIFSPLEALYVIGKLDNLPKDMMDSIIDFILSMQDEETGLFYEHYNPKTGERDTMYIASTFAAVRGLQLLGALDRIEPYREKIIRSVFKYFYYPDGSFGDGVFHTTLTNFYGVMILDILGSLNKTIARRNAMILYNLIDSTTGIERDGNLDATGTIVNTLAVLGYLDLLPRNKTINTLLSMQDHKYGGFFSVLSIENEHTRVAGLRTIYGAVSIFVLLNATEHFNDPFYIEEIPDFSWSSDSINSQENSGSSSDNLLPFPPLYGSKDNNVGDHFIIGLVIFLSAMVLLVAPVVLFFEKIFSDSKHRTSKRRRIKYRKR